MKFLSNLNLNKNQLQNAVIHPLGTAPSTPSVGQIYYDTQDFKLKIWNGTIFEVVGKEFTGGTYITVTGTTINHDSTTRSDTTSTVSPAYAGSFAVVDTVTTNGTGHITAINVKTVTLPAAYVHPTFDGDDIDIDTGALTGATVISDLDFNITTNAEGHVTDANATIATRTLTLADLGYTGDADANNKVYDISAVTTTGGALLRLNDSDSVTDDVKFASGTQVNVVHTDANTITINHADVTRSDGTSTASPGFAGTFTVVDGVTSDARGHVTAVNVKTVTVPTETQLSDVDTGTGTWLTDITVDNHQITLSRSDTTTATITVGELIITKAEDPAQTGNLTVGGNAVITGNLTVNGTTTTLNTETVLVEDNIIEINSTQTGTPASSLVSGIEVNRGDEDNFQFVFVELTDDFRLGKVGGTLQPVLTRDETTNLANNDILVWDNANKRAIGQTFDELALPNKYAVTIGDGTATTYTITHNLNTTDITYSVKELSNGEIVFTNVTVTGVNTISVSFAVAPTTNQYRVVVIG